jgi:hypothetical protein
MVLTSPGPWVENMKSYEFGILLSMLLVPDWVKSIAHRVSHYVDLTNLLTILYLGGAVLFVILYGVRNGR